MSPSDEPRLIINRVTGPYGSAQLAFDTMVLSDHHLGTPESRADALSFWLHQTTAIKITLNGDIVDAEYLQKTKQRQMPTQHQQVLRYIFAKAQESSVQFVPGNHDYRLRKALSGKIFNSLPVANDVHLRDPRGRQILICHGDEFDAELTGQKPQGFWHSFGDQFILRLQKLDRDFQTLPQKVRTLAGFPPDYSFAHNLKRHWLRAQILNRMETHQTCIDAIDKMQDADVLITGHTHMGGFYASPNGKLYMNSGSATDYAQALVCDQQGLWALLTVRDFGLTFETEKETVYNLTWEEMGIAPPTTRIEEPKNFTSFAKPARDFLDLALYA